MPSTTVVVACAVLAVFFVILVLRARSKAAAEAAPPRFEPPRELAKRPAKEPAKDAASGYGPASSKGNTPAMAFPPSGPLAAAETPTPHEDEDEHEDESTRIDAIPPSTEEVGLDQILESEAVVARRPAATPTMPPPLPSSTPTRPPLPSYSNISDEADDEAARGKAVTDKPTSPPPESAPQVVPPAPTAAEAPRPPAVSRAPTSDPKLAIVTPKPISAPRPPTSQPKLPTSEPKLSTSEPKVPVAAKSETKASPRSEPKAPAVASGDPVAARPDEHDFSALNDAAPAKKVDAASARMVAATVAKLSPPPNPATAELETSDPRHAAARRLARISVSEIKLYHEDEVKAGREANDLWKRLSQDIGLAKQTFDARTPAEVRGRFDYLYDEILRQLAEGDLKKLGKGAPAPGGAAEAGTKTAPARPSEPKLEVEAPTNTLVKPLEAPTTEAATTAKKAPDAKPAEPKSSEPKAVAAEPARGTDAGKPSGLAARLLPSNPETAELEKSDSRHAAARRLARLSVSEIKLYHEDEVKAGREAKDLWKRLIADIGLATQTYEKRVDKEVRERFDYLYDEILRQLAEGDVAKLGPDAPSRPS